MGFIDGLLGNASTLSTAAVKEEPCPYFAGG